MGAQVRDVYIATSNSENEVESDPIRTFSRIHCTYLWSFLIHFALMKFLIAAKPMRQVSKERPTSRRDVASRDRKSVV